MNTLQQTEQNEIDMKENSLQVAQIIRQQLGGNRFAFMTGARQFVATTVDGCGALRFRVARKIMVIRLTAMDDYTVTLYSSRLDKTGTCKVVAEQEGVYCDTLAQVFECMTGLVTSL